MAFLELANATDFAANAWNQQPPPVLAVVLMSIGGTTALVILCFGIWDLPRSWQNCVLLRHERKTLCSFVRALRSGQVERLSDGLTQHDLETHLDVNTRELGNELVDRFFMGLALGFGALTVGIGTYMAIAGANTGVFYASNVLTGYLGNVPTTIYGLANAAWCSYGYRRAQTHIETVRSGIPRGPWDAEVDIAKIIQRRESHVKLHALVNGVGGVLGGIGGLMTSTAYIHFDAVWGYLILIPSIVAAVYANLAWRKKLNYDRDMVKPAALDVQGVLNTAGYASLTEELVIAYCKEMKKTQSLLHRRKALTEALPTDRLSQFLRRYSRLTARMLEQRSIYVEGAIEAIETDARPSDQELLIQVHTASLMQERVSVQRQLGYWNTRLSTERSTFKSAGSIQLEALAQDILAVLSDLLVTVDLCARLANKTETTALLNADAGPDAETNIMVDTTTLEQNVAQHPELIEDFIETALDTLAIEGRQAAQSRLRYTLELLGSYFQDRRVR